MVTLQNRVHCSMIDMLSCGGTTNESNSKEVETLHATAYVATSGYVTVCGIPLIPGSGRYVR